MANLVRAGQLGTAMYSILVWIMDRQELLGLKDKKTSPQLEAGLILPSTEDDLNCLLSGPDRDRTDDLLRARQALSQLSYGPLSADSFTIW